MNSNINSNIPANASVELVITSVPISAPLLTISEVTSFPASNKLSEDSQTDSVIPSTTLTPI